MRITGFYIGEIFFFEKRRGRESNSSSDVKDTFKIDLFGGSSIKTNMGRNNRDNRSTATTSTSVIFPHKVFVIQIEETQKPRENIVVGNVGFIGKSFSTSQGTLKIKIQIRDKVMRKVVSKIIGEAISILKVIDKEIVLVIFSGKRERLF